MTLDCTGQNEKRKTYIGHLKYWGYKLQEINIEIDKYDKILDLNWQKFYSINIYSFSTNRLPLRSQINIYTNGSKTDQHVGSGYSIMRGNEIIIEGSVRLPNESTAFQVELFAIRKAMLEVSGHLTIQDRYIKLFSDSRAAIQALNSSTVSRSFGQGRYKPNTDI